MNKNTFANDKDYAVLTNILDNEKNEELTKNVKKFLRDFVKGVKMFFYIPNKSFRKFILEVWIYYNESFDYMEFNIFDGLETQVQINIESEISFLILGIMRSYGEDARKIWRG